MTSKKVTNNFPENRQGSSHLREYNVIREQQDPFRQLLEAIGEKKCDKLNEETKLFIY